MQITGRHFIGAAAFALALGAAGVADAGPPSPLIGHWACIGQNGGLTLQSTFDYRADGTYVSTQHISGGNDFIEGGGGGTWRLEGDLLIDTKLVGRLDRYVVGGVDVPSSDPTFQQIAADTQTNLGQTTSATVRFEPNAMFVGIYACHRAP